MTAIETKYIGPTNHRSARIKAFTRSSPNCSLLIEDYCHDIPNEQNHINVATRLIAELDWQDNGQWVCGETANGMVFVCCPTISK